jgi:hypothetical protein
MTMTKQDRIMRARVAAYTLHANCADPKAHTAPARKAFMTKFERDVDPNGVLPVEERRRRALLARKAHMSRLALKSAQSRRARSGQAG